METLANQGIFIDEKRLEFHPLLSILPVHQDIDSKQESLRREESGTTGRGIGPCYTDKVARVGVRMMDLLSKDRLKNRLSKHPNIDQNTL